MKVAAGVALAAATCIALFAPPWAAIGAALVVVGTALLLDPTAVRAGTRFSVVVAVLFAGAVTAAVVAWAEGPTRGLENGGMVLLRLFVLVVAAAILVRRVDAELLLVMTQRMGFERLGLVLGLALNSLPRIAAAASDVWAAHRTRTRSPSDRIRRMPGLVEVLLAHTARIAEEASAAASLRGHSALTRPGRPVGAPPRTVVVTGRPNSGKTAAIIELSRRLETLGIAVAGFAQLGERRQGRKVGFRLRDLASGEETPLAVLAGDEAGEFGTRFRFFDRGFAAGRGALAQAKPGSIVVIDELGPVELRGAGHLDAVRNALSISRIKAAVIVVRRSLVPSFLAIFEASDAVVVDVDAIAGDPLAEILAALDLQ